MKNLKDTIYEKLSVDNIVFPDIELPKNLDFTKLLNILQECGFREIQFKENPSFFTLKTEFSNAHTKVYSCFGMNGNQPRIRFADTSKEPICGKNHILTYCPKSSVRYCSEYDHYYQFEMKKSDWYKVASQLINR